MFIMCLVHGKVAVFVSVTMATSNTYYEEMLLPQCTVLLFVIVVAGNDTAAVISVQGD